MSKNVDLTSKEWCDLVFEGKNKAFGGYLLRVNSPKRLLRHKATTQTYGRSIH